MEKLVRVDDKGRVRIPREFMEDIGESVVVKKTREGLLILPGEEQDFLGEFTKLIKSEPKRIGKPRNPPPARMKHVWK